MLQKGSADLSDSSLVYKGRCGTTKWKQVEGLTRRRSVDTIKEAHSLVRATIASDASRIRHEEQRQKSFLGQGLHAGMWRARGSDSEPKPLALNGLRSHSLLF